MRHFSRALAGILAGVFLLGSTAIAQPPPTFSEAGTRAVRDLIADFYAQGKWKNCDRGSCDASDSDWGADAATYTLYLRWTQTHNPEFAGKLGELLANAPRYGAPCNADSCANWSDTPAWDAVAAMREYDVLHDPRALANAQAALAYVQSSTAFARGACSSIPFQHPPQSSSKVKTLETTANAVKADILVYEATHDAAYLQAAQAGYASAREFFLDPSLPLYTVHVIDDGATCTQVDHRFFASVNGDMIWNGLHLMRLTGDTRYGQEAVATAHAVDEHLSDARGIFANIQGDNDVAEPLVEAMLDLAQHEHFAFARNWIVRNATAALSARTSMGSFSRFFDGPPQASTSIWQANGGFALEIAAASVAPNAAAVPDAVWNPAQDVSVNVNSLPATITIHGSGIALVGTITPLCQKGHIRVIVDGVQTTDHTGLWQNPGMPDTPSVLFAWRWPSSGEHTIVLEPGDRRAALPDALSVSGYVSK